MTTLLAIDFPRYVADIRDCLFTQAYNRASISVKLNLQNGFFQFYWLRPQKCFFIGKHHVYSIDKL